MGIAHEHDIQPRRSFYRYGKSVLHTSRWRRVRKLVLRRDGYQCCHCRAFGRLEVDHIKPVRDALELAYELTNLQALCPTCHTYKTRQELGQKTEPVSVETIRNRRHWRSLVSDLETPSQANRGKLHA